jgi:hypothetical protein
MYGVAFFLHNITFWEDKKNIFAKNLSGCFKHIFTQIFAKQFLRKENNVKSKIPSSRYLYLWCLCRKFCEIH